MRPPYCCICQKDFEPDARSLITFAKTQADLEWDKRLSETGGVGHPPYMDWFCEEHRPVAEKLRHLTLAKAIRRIQGK